MGDIQMQCISLFGDVVIIDVGNDVVCIFNISGSEGFGYNLLMDFVWEVVFQSVVVDFLLVRVGSDVDVGDGFFVVVGGSIGGDYGGVFGIIGSYGWVGVGVVGDFMVVFGEWGDFGVFEVFGWGVSYCYNFLWVIIG